MFLARRPQHRFPPALARGLKRPQFSANITTNSEIYPCGLSGISGEKFTFSSPKLVVGNGIAATAVTEAMLTLGMKNPLIVTGASGLSRLPKDLQAALNQQDLQTSHFAADTGVVNTFSFRESSGNCVQINVKAEPTVNAVLAGTSVAILQNCDGVVAVGGGSAIDTGKAISAMITNHGDIYDHLDVETNRVPLCYAPVPFVAIPTVSGSGLEVTKKSLLRCGTHDRTLALEHAAMAPKITIVDPLLATSSPPRETACSGFNALYQIIAGYIGDDRNPMVDSLCLEGIVRISRSLRDAVRDGNNIRAREDLALGSVFCGLVQENSKLGTVYGIANALGGLGMVSRTALCASIFPKIFVATIEKSEKRFKELEQTENRSAKDEAELLYISRMLHRTYQVAQILTDSRTASLPDMAAYLCAMKEDLKIPEFKELCDFKEDVQFRKIAERAVKFSQTEGNTVELTVDEIEKILKEVL